MSIKQNCSCSPGYVRVVFRLASADSIIDLVLQVVYARTVTYPWALALAKISILIFYRRIFPIDKFRKICEWFIAVMILMTLATSMASAFACHPLGNGPKLIHRVKGDGCIDRFALQFVANALHLVTDVMIWLLPMKHLWHLRVKKQKRIRTIVIFSLGLIPCIASAIRLQTIHRLYKGVDPTYDAVGIAIWSSIEVNLVIIAASIPASSTFYNTFFVQPVRKRFVNALPMKPLPDSDSYPFNNSNYMWTIEGAKTTIPTSQGENTKSTPATKGIHMTIETTRKDSCHSIYNPDPDGLDEEERYGQHVAQG